METPGPAPEPHIDEDPDPGNEAGGTDAVPEDDTVPPISRELPPEAQVTEDVPAEIKEPEGPDSEANTENPTAEPSA